MTHSEQAVRHRAIARWAAEEADRFFAIADDPANPQRRRVAAHKIAEHRKRECALRLEHARRSEDLARMGAGAWAVA